MRVCGVADLWRSATFSLRGAGRKPTIRGMESLLSWPPLVWTLRLLLLVYAGGILYVSTLYLARFLRPGNAWRLLSDELPSFARVEGTAKVMGQELSINADVAGTDIDRLSAVERRVGELEVYVRDLAASVHFLGELPASEGNDD